jgi:uncharacterized protein (UPF0548 family)
VEAVEALEALEAKEALEAVEMVEMVETVVVRAVVASVVVRAVQSLLLVKRAEVRRAVRLVYINDGRRRWLKSKRGLRTMTRCLLGRSERYRVINQVISGYIQ